MSVPSRHSRELSLAAPAFAAAFLLAGCGSSSSPTTQSTTSRSTPHSASPGWHIVSKRTVPGRAVASIGGTVANPSAMQVRVEASPNVTSQVNYSIDCERSGTHPMTGTIRQNRTPLTAVIPVPLNASSCFVDVTASKSSSAAMTLTLLIRRAAPS